MKSEHKTFTAEVKEFNDEKLIVTHFISTERRDRGGDSMKADGMKVKGKAVVLMAHGFTNMGQEPIAKPLKLWADTFKGSPGICARTQFYDGSHLNPPDNTGRRLYEKAKTGFMPNWSIGFIPLKWEDSKGPKGECYRDVLEWELLEYSPVGVPMNPDAQSVDKEGQAWFKICPPDRTALKSDFKNYAVDGKSLWDDAADQDGRLKFEVRTYGELCRYKGGVLVDMEGKPYPNEHACRLHPPGGYKRVRRQNDKLGKGIHAIWGIKRDDSVELQAIRFSKDKFTAKEARQWCKDHEYSCKPFEAATEKCGECGADMAVKWEGDVSADEGAETMELEFEYVCESCEEKRKRPRQCKCEKCGHVVEWSSNCDGMKCPVEGCSGAMKTVQGEKSFVGGLKRWNKSLPELFDLDIDNRPPATWEYDLYQKFLKCRVKDIFLNCYQIPSPLLGTYLSGIKQISEKFTLLDTRNFTRDGFEEPPVREVIKLNSTKSDDFLVSGIEFFKYKKYEEIPFLLKFSPNWYGIEIHIITDVAHSEFNKGLLEEIHQWVKENNFLKGERFALSGDFLEKTDDAWSDLILEDDLKTIVKNAINQLNSKKSEMKSRGLLFVGRPGTGKTKAGRTIMNNSDSTFVWVSSKDFRYGSSVGMISLAFSLAKDLSPAVIFMEDIDTWLGSYLVDLLKTEMDGLRQNTGIVTILTSNNPENLPDALLDRPGRFHHVLDFKLPNAKQRLSMINLWIEEKIDGRILSKIVKETEGFSGAHMRELVDFAKILSEENNVEMGKAIEESLSRLMKQRDLINRIRMNQKSYSLPIAESEFKAIRSDQADVVKFVMVDGDEVREKNNIDFTMGAHHYVPRYEKIISEDEIWIDQSMSEQDTIATKLHEFTERLIMKYLDWEYNDAHEIASKPERLLRHIMWAETDEEWENEDEGGNGDSGNGDSGDEEDEEDWEEYDGFIKDMIFRSPKILGGVNKIRERRGFKPLILKVKGVRENEVDSFIDFIKTMRERFQSMEEKLDGLAVRLQEGLKASVINVSNVVPATDDKTGETKTGNQPELTKIVALDEKEEERKKLSEMSKQLSKQLNEVLMQHEESTRQLVRAEIRRARGRVD